MPCSCRAFLPKTWAARLSLDLDQPAGVRPWRALRDVAPPTHWLLIAGEDGAGWCEGATTAAAARGLDLTAVRVGHVNGDWLDPRLAFLRVREFGRGGAILVRPDRVIAWRSREPATDAALDQVLVDQ